MYVETMITPNGDAIKETGDRRYFHSIFSILIAKEGSKPMDMQLPNGDWLHSVVTTKGEFILISKKL